MVEIEFKLGRPRLSDHDREAFEALRQVLELKRQRGLSHEDWAAYRSMILSAPARQGDADARSPGAESGTLARCRAALGDMQLLFGELDGMDIVEIGAGYGGQCKLIADAHAFERYTIVDLAPMTELVFKYLERVGCSALGRVRGVSLTTPDGWADATFDLVISNWTLSEWSRAEQDRLIHTILRRARRGYIAYNGLSHLFGADAYHPDAFVQALGFPVQRLSGGSGAESDRSVLYWTRQPLLSPE